MILYGENILVLFCFLYTLISNLLWGIYIFTIIILQEMLYLYVSLGFGLLWFLIGYI